MPSQPQASISIVLYRTARALCTLWSLWMKQIKTLCLTRQVELKLFFFFFFFQNVCLRSNLSGYNKFSPEIFVSFKLFFSRNFHISLILTVFNFLNSLGSLLCHDEKDDSSPPSITHTSLTNIKMNGVSFETSLHAYAIKIHSGQLWEVCFVLYFAENIFVPWVTESVLNN